MITAIKEAVKRIVFTFIKPPIVNNSNSQAGEDRIIAFLFSSMGINKISYIDIGANDPIGCNNTYLFYKAGNTGLIVEPDPLFNDRLRQVRPNDIIIDAAISNKEGEADFYIFNDHALNTLAKEDVPIRQSSGKYKLVETKKIKLLTIETLINKWFPSELPNLISLDVEGMDYDILKGFNFEKYPVPVWIVETCAYSEDHIKPKVNLIIDTMKKNGYFVYADTYINTIFVRSDWFNGQNSFHTSMHKD